MRKEMLDYVYKHGRKRNNDLKYDFMPELLELIEKPAHIGGKVIIYGTALLLFSALIWAGLSKVDIVVSADAYVIPEGNVCNVNTSIAGTIKEINVSDGDYVSKGDVLITLDSEAEEEQSEYITEQLEICKAENEIYEQILNGTSVDEISIDTFSDTCKSAITSIIENQKYNELNIEYTAEQSGEGSTYTSMAVQKNRAEITDKIADNNVKITELTYELSQLELAMAEMNITAPENGYVSGLSVNAAGTYVAGTQQLLTIIPNEVPLIVQCYVSDADISDIKYGQKTAIKLSAFPYSDYGVLNGTVVKIGANAEYVENRENVYIVEVEIEDADKFDLMTGMSGSVEMKLGKRSVLQYLFEPVMNKFNDSLKEK